MSGAKVVILGSGGLVGRRLATYLKGLSSIRIGGGVETSLRNITLFDMKTSEDQVQEFVGDSRAEFVEGNLLCQQTMEHALQPNGAESVSVIHLAALLSGYAEDNFDLGIDVNVHGTFNVMNRVRALKDDLGAPQQYLYVSTDYVACFNDQNRATPVTEESFRLSPVSYGVQKAAMELFVCDYTRKGLIDGRVGRLSAVIGRPGFSNSISYPYTGIFTQPLEGKDYEVSLPLDIPYPCSSLNNNSSSLIHFMSNVKSEDLGHNRVVQLPAKSWTLNEIWEATQEVAKSEGLSLGKMTPVAADKGATTVKEINVCPYVDCSKAENLGFPMNVDLKEIIRDYVNNYVRPGNKA